MIYLHGLACIDRRIYWSSYFFFTLVFTFFHIVQCTCNKWSLKLKFLTFKPEKEREGKRWERDEQSDVFVRKGPAMHAAARVRAMAIGISRSQRCNGRRYASGRGVWELGVETERNGAKESATKGSAVGKGRKKRRAPWTQKKMREEKKGGTNGRTKSSDKDEEEEEEEDDNDDKEEEGKDEKKKGASDGE